MMEPHLAKPTHKHIAHTTPYQLKGVPIGDYKGKIRNLHTYITNIHHKIEIAITTNKFTYVDKWLSNAQIHHKLSN